MQTHDYFLVALAFLVVTLVMVLVVFLWLPQDPVLVGFVGGSAIYLNREWPVRILLLSPFSLFLGFVIAGALKSYLFSPK